MKRPTDKTPNPVSMQEFQDAAEQRAKALEQRHDAHVQMLHLFERPEWKLVHDELAKRLDDLRAKLEHPHISPEEAHFARGQIAECKAMLGQADRARCAAEADRQQLQKMRELRPKPPAQ